MNIIEQLLKDLSHKELYDFVIKHSRLLKDDILLEFAHKIDKNEVNNSNNYTQLLRDALDGISFDYEDIMPDYEYGYDEFDGCLELDALGKWLDKAQEHVDKNNPNEAILICKACLEEYASWCETQDSDILEYVDVNYREQPFDILRQTLSMQGINQQELLDYCKSEISKPKYKRAYMYDGFSRLFMDLSVMVGSDDFIILQDNLLHEIEDKSSYEAEQILKQKIDFYHINKQSDRAWDIIRENLQIKSFRKDLTKKLIAENKLQEAKKLINDHISNDESENKPSLSWHELRSWDELKLQIAQKENDIPEIRHISFRFIESDFNAQYYKLYKSTFAKEEWTEQVEKLIQHYEKRYGIQWFSESVADVLRAEKQEERLMKYIEKHLSIDNVEQYHTCFSSSFPEKTLALFRQAIDKYASQNTGRDYYEHIVRSFGKMIKIQGGNEVVKEMINQYRVLYKNRRAMMEIMGKFTLKTQSQQC